MNTIRHLNMRFMVLVMLLFVLPCRAQNDFEIAKNVDIFISILKELNAKYADEISPGDLTKTAIDAMLKSMDPYTVYYPESQIEDFKMMTTGQYGGIGALIQQQDDYVLISEPYEGCPAQLSGLIAGDKILKINGQSTKGKTTADVSAILKGQPGTEVEIEVERLGEEKPLTIAVKRKEIKLPNLPYYGMLDDSIGYIKLDQFTDNASKEVREAFLKLKKQGMTSLVFDLRNNGGGLLHEAVNIMNIFVDQNTVIVETRGKIKSQQAQHKTLNAVTDKQIPVVVLVNGYSASASEIVSGAFQDLDRGVVIGKKTFGKGLVQNVVPLSYNSTLKLTVSKYYIPSGRCVQNIDYFNEDTLKGSALIPDSLATPFKTRNGRTVYDKGGVEPDIVMPDTLSSNILLALVLNNHIFNFANLYYSKHSSIPPADQFKVDDALYAEFVDYLKDKKYDYKSNTEEFLGELKDMAVEENYFKAIENLYDEMKTQLEKDKANDLYKFKQEISEYLASEIVVRYYYQKGRIINALKYDPDVLKAKEVLNDPERYNSILSGKK